MIHQRRQRPARRHRALFIFPLDRRHAQFKHLLRRQRRRAIIVQRQRLHQPERRDLRLSLLKLAQPRQALPQKRPARPVRQLPPRRLHLSRDRRSKRAHLSQQASHLPRRSLPSRDVVHHRVHLGVRHRFVHRLARARHERDERAHRAHHATPRHAHRESLSAFVSAFFAYPRSVRIRVARCRRVDRSRIQPS